MIDVKLKEDGIWNKYVKKNIIFWIKGFTYSHTIEDLINKFIDIKKYEITSFLNSIDGHFALAVQREDITFIAVDKIRSTPLFFTNIANNFYIDHDPKNLFNLNGFDKTLDESAKLEIAMSGYTIGNKTIYKNLYSLKAGEIAIFQNNRYEYATYYKYFGEIVEKNYDDYIENLSEVTLNIFQKMLTQIGDRQIIIPLSAGNDSRLVASILKHLGATNVKCYSYGTPENFEAAISKMVAYKLGYDWKFLPLNYKSEKKFYASLEYNKYLDFSETYCSVSYIQSLSTIKY